MLREIREFLISAMLKLLRPVVFALINFKPFLISSRFFMRLFNPRRDLMVTVRGKKMYANSLDRLLALLFWKHSLVEGYELDLMKRLVSPGMTVVNCGANIGYYTLQMSDWVGEFGRVYAFEPDPNSFRLLKKNIEANGLRNISIENKAVSNKSEPLKLFFCEENRGDHRVFDSGDGRPALEIEATTLDDFFSKGEKIDLVKMDIQGAEPAALEGMLKLIERNPDIIILSEFCPTLLAQGGSSGDSYLARLQQLGFETIFVDENKETLKPESNDRLLDICKDQYYCSILVRRPKPTQALVETEQSKPLKVANL